MNGNVRILGGNVTLSGQINALGNVVALNFIGDTRGNIIGNFANVITGNIGNTRFVGGNVAVSGQINTLGNVVAPFFIGDNRGNITGDFANVITGNIGNTRFVGGNVAVSGQINVLGNVAASFYRGNGSLLEGITSTLPSVANIDIIGNVTAPGNIIVAGQVNVTGNVAASFYRGNGSLLEGITATLPSVANIDIIGNVTAPGNIIVAGQVNVTGNVAASFYRGNGSLLEGITATLPANGNSDILGNIIGNYANMHNVVGVIGNIGNTRFVGGNVAVSGQINVLGNVVALNFIGDNRGNITGDFANVITGNIGNVRIGADNVTARTHQIVDNFYITTLTNSTPVIYFDVDDSMYYERTTNTYTFLTEGVVRATIDNKGNLTASGNIIGKDGIFSGNVVATRDIRGSNTMTLTCASNANVLTITGTTLNTNGSLIQGTSLRGATSEYSLIRLENAVGKVFEVDGRGRVLSNNATNNDCVDIRCTSSAYTADMLNIQSNIGTASTYNFINCTTNAGATNTFSVNGRGDINSGLILANTTINANLFTVQSESGSFSNIAIQAIVPRLSVTEYSFISCRNQNGTLFNINGTGAIESTMAVNQGLLNLKANLASFANVVIAANVSARVASSAYSFLTFDNGSGRALEVDGRGAIYANVFFSANGISMFNTASAMTQDMIRLAVPTTIGSAAYNFISCKNNVGNVFRVNGLGTTYGVGAFNTSSADYAEMFQWEDGNASDEDRRGRAIVLGNNGTVRIASPLDNPTDVFGVVSVNPSVLGDTMWNEWSGRFLRDKFGAKLSNTVYFLVSVSDENERIRCGINDTAPDGYEKVISSEFIENPKFDPKIHYISRENRPEWVAIGLLGKLRVLPGEIVNPNWKLLKTHKHADGDTLEYLVK